MSSQLQLRRRPRRIFIGPTEIAGFYANLLLGFRNIGQPAEFIDLGENPFKYAGSDPLPRLLRWRNGLQETGRRGGALQKLFGFLAKSLYYLWFISAILRYDSFIFSFGNSLLPRNWDLPLLKFLGKTIICNLSHGSEARPPYLDGSWYSQAGRHPGFKELHRLTQQIKTTVKKCEKSASWIIGAPYSSSPFLTRPFVNLFAIGIPLGRQADLGEGNSIKIKTGRATAQFRVVHSPSHPFVKGTGVIRQAVRNLQHDGFELELVELRGVPNSAVMEAVAKCDFVIDQVFSDLPMAGFALEAAAIGRPAIVGGEHLEALKAFVSPGMWPPTVTCKPNELEETIRKLLLNPQEISTRGTEARDFVERKWRAEDVARRYLSILRNQVPEEWLLSPDSVHFPREVGISSKEAQKNIDGMIASFGPESLGL